MSDAFDTHNVEIIEGGALKQIVGAEVDIQVATAKRWPRSISEFREETLTMATIDQETATECTYAIPRAGKIITGPSIRMAELIACNWGNSREEKRALEPEATIIRGQGTMWDLQRNRAVRAETTRRITDREGRRYNEDMISMTGNAAASVAHRNAVLACVPKALWRGIHRRVMEVAAGDAATLPENVEKWLEFWAKREISRERVLSALNRRDISDVSLSDLGKLQGLCTAHRDGNLDLETAFPSFKAGDDEKNGAPKPGRRSYGGKRKDSPQRSNGVESSGSGEPGRAPGEGGSPATASPAPAATAPDPEPGCAECGVVEPGNVLVRQPDGPRVELCAAHYSEKKERWARPAAKPEPQARPQPQASGKPAVKF